MQEHNPANSGGGKMFLGPIERNRFVSDKDWEGAVSSAFVFEPLLKYTIGDVSAVLVASRGKPGERDWIAIAQIDDYWWLIIAGYPKGSSWSEGIGHAKQLSKNMSLAIHSPVVFVDVWWRCLPQLLRLHAEAKIDISNQPFFKLDAVRSMQPDQPESIVSAVKAVRENFVLCK